MSNVSLHFARWSVLAAVGTVAGLLVGAPAVAQQAPALDRTAVPPAGKPAELHIPTWSTATLPNGATLVVSERHTLPLVSVRINFIGGTSQFEPANRAGLASMTSQMLVEGTTHRTGDQIATGFQLLGTNLGVSIGTESGVVTFQATKDKFNDALALTADVLLNPTFPEAALTRLRGQALVALTQSHDRTTSIAAAVFPKVVYGPEHPYAHLVADSTLQAITRDDVVAFHRTYFQPQRAVITVVGDVTLADVQAAIAQDFARWTAGTAQADFTYPAPASAKPRTIFLIDKPGAAQSTFIIGHAGPPRSTPDYYAIRVMNEILGVLFQSRLNHTIREVKGYSYGASSNFAFGRGPGAFRAMSDIVTAKTDSALLEFMNELQGLQGPKPPTDDELAQAKAGLVQSLPETFASVAGVNSAIASIYVQQLPEDYFQQFARQVNAVTAEDVVRVAKQYLDPAHFTILIVGDAAKVADGLRRTGVGPVVMLTVGGDELRARVTP